MFFIYHVIDRDGKEVKGEVNAITEYAAIQQLQSKGFTIVRLSRKKENVKFILWGSVRRKHITFVSRQLATLFGAQVSGLQAIRTVARYTENKIMKNALIDIAVDLQAGKSITNAFKKQEPIFGSFFVSIIEIGYESGTLPDSFTYLADYLEQGEEIYNRVKKALTYPAIVVIVFFIVIFLLFSSIVPRLAGVLRGMNVDLPFLTKVVLAIGDFFSQHSVIVIFAFISSLIIGVWYTNTPSGKAQLDRILFSIPLVSRLIQQFHFIRFTEGLVVLLRGGVPIVQSLHIISKTFKNTIYSGAILNIASQVRSGNTLSNAIKQQGIFGQEITGFIRVGEESGGLAEILKSTGIFYRLQFIHTIDMMVDLIQPATIILLGVGVGGVVAAILLPIYTLTSSL